MIKNLVYVVCLPIGIGLLMMCSQQQAQEGTPLVPNVELAKVLTQQVGDPIDVDLASNWIRAFERENTASGVVHWYDINRPIVAQLLAQQYAGHAVDGLRFMKGINDQGIEELVVVPVQGGNDLWYLSYPGSDKRLSDMGIAHNKNGILPAAKAKQWVDLFKNRNPSSEIRNSYFIGSEVLQKIVLAQYNGKPADALRFYKAWNDDHKETFIIAPVQNGKTLGPLEYKLSHLKGKSDSDIVKINQLGLRTFHNNDELVTYYEYMSPCPPTCDSPGN